MDHVANAQLIFPGTSTEASAWSFFPAYVTDAFLLCNDFANRDQKSLLATFQSHSSILSIKSVNKLQCHSSNVRANCASIIFLQHHHAACICLRAAAGLARALLMAGDTLGHPLRLGRCIESLQLTVIRAMRFYALVHRSSADPTNHSATI